MMKKFIYLVWLLFTLAFSGLRADSGLYLEPGRHFLLNPALQDSCLALGAKFYNGKDELSEYHLAVNKMVGKSCLSWEGDYLYFKAYERLQTTLGANLGWRRLVAGGNLVYCLDDLGDEAESKTDGLVSLGLSYAWMQSYLICSSLRENRWAAEFRQGKRLVVRVDDEGEFLLSSQVPLHQFCSLQVSLRQESIGTGVRLHWQQVFVQFSAIAHRYVESDYLVGIGMDL